MKNVLVLFVLFLVTTGFTCEGPVDDVSQLELCSGLDESDQIGKPCTRTECPTVQGTWICNGRDSMICYVTSCVGVINTCYPDVDGDHYGSIAAMSVSGACPTGWTTTPGDCRDNDANSHPGATDICGDNIDQDCNGSDLLCPSPCAGDVRVDNHQTCEVGVGQCKRSGVYVCQGNLVACSVTAGTPVNETCNSLDDDCDGAVDDGDVCGTLRTWYRDADGDGIGNSNVTITAVSQPAGYVAVGGDCNDNAYSTSNQCNTCTKVVEHESGALCNNNADDDCDTFFDGNDPDCAPVCLPISGGTLRIEITQAVRNACPNNVIVVWGPGGIERRSAVGASFFQEFISASWQGYVHTQLLCSPKDAGQAGTAGYWDGTLYSWPSAGTDLSNSGINISFNSTTLGNDRVVNVSGGQQGEGWLPLCQ